MKKTMKCFISIALSLLCVVSLTGCKFLDWYFYQVEHSIISIRERAEKQRKEFAQKIIDCIKEKNADGVIEMLCLDTQSISDIREQIEAGFDFINGEIESYTIKSSYSYEGYGTTEGLVDEYGVGQHIFNIVTDLSQVYEIYFEMFYIHSDTNLKGVNWITITNNGNPDTYEDDLDFEIGCKEKDNDEVT